MEAIERMLRKGLGKSLLPAELQLRCWLNAELKCSAGNE